MCTEKSCLQVGILCLFIFYFILFFRFRREDENDKSDSDDEPVAFSLNHREKELRNMQNTILAAQEGMEQVNF